jgi:hypothetical protein
MAVTPGASTWRAERARLTLLHALSAPGRLGGSGPLASSADYQQTLAALLGGTALAPFELPWEPRWSTYWEHLIGPEYRTTLTSQQAAAQVIPVRVRPGIQISVPPVGGAGLKLTAIRTEGLIYPHAAVTMVTMDLEGDATLAETADGIALLAATPLTVGDQETRLATMAGIVAPQLRTACGFGPVIESAERSLRVFSVLSGMTQSGGIPDPAAEWAAMRAITALKPWRAYAEQSDPFPRLALSWGTRKLAYFNGDAVSYTLADNFGGPRSSNSCYHRNQVLLASHLLALSPLVIWGAPKLLTHNFAVEADRLVPAAARTIDALTRRTAYRSALTTVLVKELGVASAVDAVLASP